MGTPPEVAEIVRRRGADLGGVTVDRVLRAQGKALLLLGHMSGDPDPLPVVVKVLATDEEFWAGKFAREIAVYAAFAQVPPPVRVPRLLHTDGHTVLAVEHLRGRPVDSDRYPRALPAGTLDAVLGTVTRFAGWQPPDGVLTPVFDYPDRVERYHRRGLLDEADRAALHRLLARIGAGAGSLEAAQRPAHGDPLPANLLLLPGSAGGCALIDFEFAGLFLPGFDLALLHTLLARIPAAQDRIEALVTGTGIEVPFLVNQAMVLTRELRIHADEPPTSPVRERLPLLRQQWRRFRTTLHERS